MLSLITTADVAVPERVRIRAGASLLWTSAPAVPRDRGPERAAVCLAAAGQAIASPRPQASTGAALLGNGAHAAGQAKSASQQPTSKKFAYTMTRIATTGGGAVGPHPARDPV